MSKSTEELANELEMSKTTEEFKAFMQRNKNDMERPAFGHVVVRLCAQYETTPSELQLKVSISKSHFYSLLSGTRNPSKESVIKIAFGIGVTQEEMDELLRSSGYQMLDPKNKEDSIILFGIKNKKTIGTIDQLLREYHSKIKLLDKE